MTITLPQSCTLKIDQMMLRTEPTMSQSQPSVGGPVVFYKKIVAPEYQSMRSNWDNLNKTKLEAN